MAIFDEYLLLLKLRVCKTVLVIHK